MSRVEVPRLPNEAERLEVLRSYAILDTPSESAFEDIARIASQICNVPIALVSLVDSARQWFKAEVGLGQRETPIANSICAHAILQTSLLEIQDAQLDERFAENPLVTGGLGLRFYAGAPLLTPDGYRLGTVCVMDVEPRALTQSQRDALEALSRQTMALIELRRSLQNAEAMQKHLRQLMAVAGHDLRQPLQTIAMSLDIARFKSTDPLVIRQAGVGLSATIKLGQDLDELAVASGAVANLVAPKKCAVAMADMLAGLEAAWRPMAEHKGLRLRVAPCSADVMSNPVMLKSILGNLIGNAIKYTEHGGVLLGCRRYRNEIRIIVKDSGIGIAPERQADMFGAFQKADLRSQGLGLGLAIVRSAVDVLGHGLKLESTPGRGTTVSIAVPRAHAEATSSCRL